MEIKTRKSDELVYNLLNKGFFIEIYKMVCIAIILSFLNNI